MPHSIACRESLEYVLHPWLGLSTLLHPCLANLFEVQSGRVDLGMYAWWGNMQGISVRTARIQTHYNTTGHVSGVYLKRDRRTA